MSSHSEPLVDNPAPAVAPVWPCLLALCGGVVCDRWLRGPFLVWLGAAVAALVLWVYWMLARRRCSSAAAACPSRNAEHCGTDPPPTAEAAPEPLSRSAPAPWALAGGMCLLVMSLFAVGGLRHGLQRRWVASSHAARWATHALRPVRLKGTIIREPWLRPAPAASPLRPRPLPPRTIVSVCVGQLCTATGWRAASGIVRVHVDGDLRALPVGTTVELVGAWHRPNRPLNPGEFDTRSYLRDRGIHAVVYCEAPKSIRVLAPGGWAWAFARLRQRLRLHLATVFDERLAPDASVLARALLLGDRSELPPEDRDAFVRSGTVHILAISGLHVGLLVGFVTLLGRLFGCSQRTIALLVLAAVSWLLLVANWRPSVLRATLLTVLLGAAALRYRMARVWDALAGAAFLLVLADPTTLFNPGAQLSFLAVIAILWWSPHQRPLTERLYRWLTRRRIQLTDEPPRPTDMRKLVARLTAVHGMFLGIWLATAPLVAAQFHIVSIAGLLLNVPALAVVAVLLSLGYLLTATALVGWTWPLDSLFDLTAGVLDRLVTAGAQIGLGHRFVAGPTMLQVCGYYALGAAALAIPRSTGCRRVAWSAWWAWIAGGLAASLWPAGVEHLTVHVVAVGHGQAVLIDCPGGETLLFDAGSLSDDRRAADRIAGSLWALGRCDIDAVIVSHADIDHFNALPHLRRLVPIGAVFAPRMFFDSGAAAVALIEQELAAMHVPVRYLHRGDRLALDSPVRVSVLWPPWTARPASDNEASCVLRVEFAGRRILLPADLEGAALEELTASEPGGFDVITAPHHGSGRSSTPDFAAWARPACVVVSEGRPRAAGFLDRLRAVYPHAFCLLWTQRDGAVTVRVQPDGRLSVETFRGAISADFRTVPAAAADAGDRQ